MKLRRTLETIRNQGRSADLRRRDDMRRNRIDWSDFGERGDTDTDNPESGYWHYDANGRYLIPKYLISGDYTDMGAVGISNVRVWQDLFKDGEEDWWFLRRGSHSSEMVLIDTEKDVPEEAVEALESLNRRPVLDDDDLMHLEIEYEAKAWEEEYREDFEKALRKHLSFYEDITEEQLDQLYKRAMSDGSVVWEEHGQGGNWAYIDVDELVDALTDADFEEVLDVEIE